MMIYVNTLGKLGTEVQTLQKQQICILRQGFENAKRKAFHHLESIFNEYEEILNREIAKDEKLFDEELVGYHDSICQVMESCKVGIKKLRNPHSSL